jgi:hypothetical protein
MSKLLFRLRNVPDDEAQDVCDLLEQNEIAYFETSAGNWGISLPAIWLHDAQQFERARELIDDYQQQRALRLRREYQLSKERGEAKTIWQSMADKPMQFFACALVIAVVLYFSIQVFLFS